MDLACNPLVESPLRTNRLVLACERAVVGWEAGHLGEATLGSLTGALSQDLVLTSGMREIWSGGREELCGVLN